LAYSILFKLHEVCLIILKNANFIFAYTDIRVIGYNANKYYKGCFVITTTDLKEKIIAGLSLEDMTPDEIEDDMALFGDEGLGLDSVDAIELTLVLEKEFGVKVTNMNAAEEIFATPTSLTNYVNEQQAL